VPWWPWHERRVWVSACCADTWCAESGASRGRGQMAPDELLGGASVPSYDPRMAQVSWWRSQSVRFMLRWPSAHLCHLMNRARHRGLRPARGCARCRVGESARGHRAGRDGALKGPRGGHSDEGQPRLPARHPPGAHPAWRFPAEPDGLRPIISIHVRQGDKAKQDEALSLPSFILACQPHPPARAGRALRLAQLRDAGEAGENCR